MTKTIYLTFDGRVFRPEGPVDLEPETRVRTTLEPAEAASGVQADFLETARSLNLDGPPDWSSRFEEYLYGAPRNAE